MADVVNGRIKLKRDTTNNANSSNKMKSEMCDWIQKKVVKEEKEKVVALLEEEMQNSATLLVPLEVGTAWGQNWYEAH